MLLKVRSAAAVILLVLGSEWTLLPDQLPKEPHRAYPGSMTVSRLGIVATSQTLASQAGTAVLEHGGNAIDAAIAANAALGVIEPMMNGIGGDLFAIVYEAKSGKISGINASGWAPKGTNIDYVRAHGVTGDKIPVGSVQAVTLPGAVAGWAALQHRFGKLTLKDDLTPAIHLARNGFPGKRDERTSVGDVRFTLRESAGICAGLPASRAASSPSRDLRKS